MIDLSHYLLYRKVCAHGYSVLGRTKRDVVEIENNEWQFRPVAPPSLGAQGRHRFVKTLLEAKKHDPKRVLEVAAGGGFNAACLVEEDCDVTINDIRPLQHELNYWTTGSKIRFIEGDFFEVDPETLKPFDLVMACEVIEHVAHGDEFLRHIKRFVKPKGTLLLSTPNGNYCRSKLQTFSQIENFVELEKEQFKPDSDGHLYLYTPKEIDDMLQGLGFTNINIELSMTPWLSGHAGFRLLPKVRGLLLPYYLLDRMTTLISHAVGDMFCTQMIISASVDE